MLKASRCPASFPPEKVRDFGRDTPMERPGKPNESAACILLLARDDASHLTGQSLPPNGGELVGG